MYELTYTTDFCAAHQLVGYNGECKNLHGHNWKLTVTIEVEKLNQIGIAFDLKDLKKISEKIVKKFDHKFLNDLSPFNKINPTSENIAREIFYSLKKKLPQYCKIKKVSISESDKYTVSYYE